MNDLMKQLFDSNNYFLKIELHCDKENMTILNTWNFQNKMLSNLTCVLIYSLTECVLEDGFKNC